MSDQRLPIYPDDFSKPRDIVKCRSIDVNLLLESLLENADSQYAITGDTLVMALLGTLKVYRLESQIDDPLANERDEAGRKPATERDELLTLVRDLLRMVEKDYLPCDDPECPLVSCQENREIVPRARAVLRESES